MGMLFCTTSCARRGRSSKPLHRVEELDPKELIGFIPKSWSLNACPQERMRVSEAPEKAKTVAFKTFKALAGNP